VFFVLLGCLFSFSLGLSRKDFHSQGERVIIVDKGRIIQMLKKKLFDAKNLRKLWCVCMDKGRRSEAIWTFCE